MSLPRSPGPPQDCMRLPSATTEDPLQDCMHLPSVSTEDPPQDCMRLPSATTEDPLQDCMHSPSASTEDPLQDCMHLPSVSTEDPPQDCMRLPSATTEDPLQDCMHSPSASTEDPSQDCMHSPRHDTPPTAGSQDPLQDIIVDDRLKLVCCKAHQLYMGKNSLQRHLSSYHNAKLSTHPGLKDWIASLDILDWTDQCPRPADDSPPIAGLPVHAAFQCCVDPSCRFITRNYSIMMNHVSLKHHQNDMPEQLRGLPIRHQTHYRRVRVQTLSTHPRSIDYFVVDSLQVYNDRFVVSPSMQIVRVSDEPPPSRSCRPNDEIRVDDRFGLAFCKKHKTYIGKSSLKRHLEKYHKVTCRTHVGLKDWIASLDILDSVDLCPRPADGSPPVEGLPVYEAFQCCIDPACRFITRDYGNMRHHNYQHQKNNLPEHLRRKPFAKDTHYRHVCVQTLSTRTLYIDYFVVDSPVCSDQCLALPATAQPEATGAVDMQAIFQELEAEGESTEQIANADHAEVFTPWLNETRFRAHLHGHDLPALSAKATPAQHWEPSLVLICQSVERVMRATMSALEYMPEKEAHFTIETLEARRLNSFRKHIVSKDPVKPLQTAGSRTGYIRVAKKLVCYFARLSDGTYAGRTMFRPTVEQTTVWNLIVQLTSGEHDTDELDALVRKLSTSFVMHDIEGDRFDSVIYAFAAISFWHPQQGLEGDLNQYSSFLAQLTYVAQMWILDYCLNVSKNNMAGFPDLLQRVCLKWLNNEERTPVAYILTIRPLARSLCKRQSSKAQITWGDNAESLTYAKTKVTIAQMRDYVVKQCQLVRHLLHATLCFEFPDLPQYDIAKIHDDWHQKSVDYSFVSDSSNKELFAGSKTWLATRINSTPTMATRFWSADATGTLVFNEKEIKLYETSIQRFLEALAVLIHISSGQPARMTEFQTLTWRNSVDTARSVRVHEGYLKYVIAYHKHRNITGQNACPVRVLLPAVAQLLVQFLVLVQPFRAMLSSKVPTNKTIPPTGRLWTNNGVVWPVERVREAMVKASKAALNVRISPRTWRHITKAVSVKKLGVYIQWVEDGRLDIPGVSDDCNPYAPIPAALHLQSSHMVSTGRSLYGRSLSYGAVLNDSVMTDFTRMSLAWHAFILDSKPIQPARKRRAEDCEAFALEQPPAKRL